MQIVNSLPRQSKDLVLWILQLMALVSSNSNINLMNANNCATLVAPNLFSMEDLELFDRMLPFVKLFCTLLISSFQEFSVCLYNDAGMGRSGLLNRNRTRSIPKNDL